MKGFATNLTYVHTYIIHTNHTSFYIMTNIHIMYICVYMNMVCIFHFLFGKKVFGILVFQYPAYFMMLKYQLHLHQLHLSI